MQEIPIPNYKNALLRSVADNSSYIDSSAEIISFAMQKMDYFFDKSFDGKLVVTIDPNASTPLNNYNGVDIILTVDSNTKWNQLIYQFCHEYCHHLIVSDRQISNRTWFEEIICEVASRFFLEKVAQMNLKRPYFTVYKPHFITYANDRFYSESESFNLKETLPVAEFYVNPLTTRLIENIDVKSRPMINHAANLITPFFKSNSSLWKSVPLIRNFESDITFLENLLQWEKESNDKVVRLIRNVFESN